jgi:hypothetical protein
MDQSVVIICAPSEPSVSRGEIQRRMEDPIVRTDDKTELEDDRFLRFVFVGVWAAPGPHQAEKRRDSMRAGAKRAQWRTPENVVPVGVSARNAGGRGDCWNTLNLPLKAVAWVQIPSGLQARNLSLAGVSARSERCRRIARGELGARWGRGSFGASVEMNSDLVIEPIHQVPILVHSYGDRTMS